MIDQLAALIEKIKSSVFIQLMYAHFLDNSDKIVTITMMQSMILFIQYN